jgi:glyoxylate utilization-related uncharacterized protein
MINNFKMSPEEYLEQYRFTKVVTGEIHTSVSGKIKIWSEATYFYTEDQKLLDIQEAICKQLKISHQDKHLDTIGFAIAIRILISAASEDNLKLWADQEQCNFTICLKIYGIKMWNDMEIIPQ